MKLFLAHSSWRSKLIQGSWLFIVQPLNLKNSSGDSPSAGVHMSKQNPIICIDSVTDASQLPLLLLVWEFYNINNITTILGHKWECGCLPPSDKKLSGWNAIKAFFCLQDPRIKCPSLLWTDSSCVCPPSPRSVCAQLGRKLDKGR